MQFKPPKNNEKYHWTQHALFKMRHYGLTAQRVLRVIKNPQRIEKGVVENTIAVMQPVSVRKFSASRDKIAPVKNKDGKIWSSEIWAMYQIGNPKHETQLEIRNSKFEARNMIGNPKHETQLEIGNSKFEARNMIENSELKNLNQTMVAGRLHSVQFLRIQEAMAPQFRKMKIISAWRYPGVSPKNHPIPEEILRELGDLAEDCQ